LNRWYRQLAANDINNWQSYYKDLGRLAVKKRAEHAIEQMDYLILHGDFNKVKAESINRFLAHEQVNMQTHVNDRANKLLKSAAALEKTNERNLQNQIVTSAIDEVNKKLVEDAEAIDDAIFESA